MRAAAKIILLMLVALTNVAAPNVMAKTVPARKAAPVAPAPPRKLMSLSYSPSGIESEAQMDKGIPEAQVRADLQRIAPYTTRIRIYSVGRGLDRVPAVAKELGLKVTLGIALGGDRGGNAAEVEKAIKVAGAYPDVVDRIIVGNEAILREDISANEVIGHILHVKSALASFGTKVSTGEPWHVWLRHPELAKVVDFIGAHILVYWDGVAIADAMPYFTRRFDELQAAYPGKLIMVAETGWPAGGGTYQGAVASADAQARYLRAFARQAAAKGYDYNIVEAYDQPWKTQFEGAVGGFWGIFTADGKPKFDFQAP